MKITLIYPYCLEARIHREDAGAMPMGIYYVGAMLKAHGFEVQILNWHHLKDHPHRIRAALEAARPDIIGFSVLQANRWGAIDIAAMAKKLDPNITVVLGGVGATYLWQHLLTHFEQIDYVVLGEGEHTFLELVRCLQANQMDRIASIAGLARRQNGDVLCSPPAALIRDLDALPDPSLYFTYHHVALTRGCVGQCTFCGSPQFWGRRVRFHSSDYFVGQIQRLYHRGVRFFFVSDDTFTARRSVVIDICRQITAQKLAITWAAISRVDAVDEEMLRWMRLAGCIQISYGVESGDKRIRKEILNKHVSTPEIRSAFALTQKYGIMARAYFIYGCPGESWETIEKTLALIGEIKPLGAIFYILDLFPGTALYKDFEKRSNMGDDVWLNRIEDILYFETDPHLSREDVLAFGKRLREYFYRQLPGFCQALCLVDDPQLYRLHADFYSRLAMTFDQGEYAAIDLIPDKGATAEALYAKALSYHPDARAYLGLGIRKQKQQAHRDAIDILSQGIDHFPDHPQLNICMGVSLMNVCEFEPAATRLARWETEPGALELMIECYRQMGDDINAERCRQQLNARPPKR